MSTVNDPSPGGTRPLVGVVMPTYCEARSVPALLRELLSLDIPYRLHVLVVDDGSPDGTADRVREIASLCDAVQLHVRERGRGRGSAVLCGFARVLDGAERPAGSEGIEIIVEMDGDGSHRPADMPGMLAALANADVVIGSRYIRGGGADLSPRRRLLSMLANALSRRIFGLDYSDCTTGYRCYRASALRTIGLDSMQTDGHATHIELLHRLHQQGARIAETPIFYRARTAGTTKADAAQIWETLRSLIAMRSRDFWPGRPRAITPLDGPLRAKDGRSTTRAGTLD